MGQELSQLWQGATTLGGDLLKGDFGGAATQLGGIPNAIGGDIKSLVTNPLSNITNFNQGVSPTQGNVSAVAPKTAGMSPAGSTAMAESLGTTGAPVDIQAPQLPTGVTPTAEGGYGSIGGGAGGLAAPSVGGAAYGTLSGVPAGLPIDPMVGHMGAGGATAGSFVDPMTDKLAFQAASAGRGAAQPDMMHQLVGEIMKPGNIPKELMGGLTALNMYNASRAGQANEKMIKTQLENAQRQQAGAQNRLQSAQAGYVPSELQAGIDLAEQQAEAAIRSKYAAAGQSGTSGEMADIAAARTQAALQRFQESQQLVDQNTKILSNYDSLVGGYMKALMAQQMEQDQMFQGALGDFFTEMGLQRPATATRAASGG